MLPSPELVTEALTSSSENKLDQFVLASKKVIVQTNETINRRPFLKLLVFYVCPHPPQPLLAVLGFLPPSFSPPFSLLMLEPVESRKQIPSVLLSHILLECI